MNLAQTFECYIEGVESPVWYKPSMYVQAKNLSETVIEHGLKNVDEVWGIETHLAFWIIWRYSRFNMCA